MISHAFGDLPSEAEATVGQQWWPLVDIGVHWYRLTSNTPMARLQLVTIGSDRYQWPPMLVADGQADLSLRWVQMSLCWFCHAAVQILSVVANYHDYVAKSLNSLAQTPNSLIV